MSHDYINVITLLIASLVFTATICLGIRNVRLPSFYWFAYGRPGSPSTTVTT
ncbi:hypothetical protein C8R48DRAFT_702792 [Suillus tomentosus]|nr:hypothetical protein C8R48DRAFT_702792 [Suillus tomentosus]